MRKQILAYVDDRDGQLISEADVVTRSLTIDGVAYTLDLRTATSQMLTEALAPFLPSSTLEQDPSLRDVVAVSLAPRVVVPPIPVVPPPPLQVVVPPMPVAPLWPAVPSSAPALTPAPAPAPAEPVAVDEKTEAPRKRGQLDQPLICGQRNDDGAMCGASLDTNQGMAAHLWAKHKIRGGLSALTNGTATATTPATRARAAAGTARTTGPMPTPTGSVPVFELAKTREEFGSQVRAMREAKGLSQSRVAQLVIAASGDLNVNQTTLSKVEHGGMAYVSRVVTIAQALGLEAPYAFEGEPAPVQNDAGEWVFYCGEAGCVYPGSTDLALMQAHERFKHGKGGRSATELTAKSRANRVAQTKERIKASILNPMGDEDDEEAPERVTLVPTRPTPARTISPGVNVLASTPRPRPSTLPAPVSVSQERREAIQRTSPSFAQTAMDIDAKVTEYHDRFSKGVPDDIEVSYLDTVLWLKGMSKTKSEEALRTPDYVEIALDSYPKGYPVLRFHKEDVVSVLGLRNPKLPMVIAYYDTTSLHEDVEKVNHAGSQTRNVPDGLPRNVESMLDWLHAAGADVEYDELSGATAVPVTFKSQDLGKVPVGASVPRSEVEAGYQRIIRKIAAINDRGLVEV